MAHSKNDFDFYGSTLRIKANAPKNPDKPYELRVYLINPATTKPYTYAEILDDLTKVETDFPNLALACLVESEKIGKKSGNTLFSRYLKAKNQAEVEKKLKNVLLPELTNLAKLLGRPQMATRTKNGNITVEDLMSYIGDDALVSLANVNERSHVKSALNRTVLPAIGMCRISDFSDPEKFAQLVKAVMKKIKKDGKKATSAHYAKMAMNCILRCCKQFGGSIGVGEDALKAIQIGSQKRQTALLKAQRTDHLSDSDREKIFANLLRNAAYQILFWLVLIYAGMSIEEICAQHYGDIEVIDVGNGTRIFTCLITGYRRKATTDWRTVHITTDSFPVYRFRRVVLPPWATLVLDAIMVQWHSLYNDKIISDFSLSSDFSGKAKNPDQVRELLAQALESAGYKLAVTIQRTDRDGTVHLVPENRNIGTILAEDAKFVAAQKCIFSEPMMHATFGIAATTVDETNYLDVLSYEFAIARYLRFRRYSPFGDEAQEGCHQDSIIPSHGFAEYRLKNEGDGAAKIKLDAAFAVLPETALSTKGDQ